MPSKVSLLIPVFLFGLFSGCATPTSNHGNTARDDQMEKANTDDALKPPTKGMTKAQVRARYGRPASVTTTGSGEIWFYAFDRLGMGHAMIPFYATIHAHTTRNCSAQIIFNEGGRVKNFTWNEAPMHGM